MEKFRRGLLAGLSAGLLFAALNFVNDGTPGRTLPTVARWFGLTMSDPTASRVVGFFLLIVLGALLGVLFGAVQRGATPALNRSLLGGLILGFVYWLLFPVVLGNITGHVAPFQIDFPSFLSTFPLSLLFGLVLGGIFYQLGNREAAIVA